MTRTAVFFHYFEHNETYRENFVFFLSVAYRHDLDFFIIISGPSSVRLPELANVTYLYCENKNNDYGGYVYALSQLGNTIDKYENAIFINSSTRGPFYSSAANSRWEDRFLEILKDETHLVGSSINILPSASRFTKEFSHRFGYPQPYSHVQTTAYALSGIALRHLINIGFYSINDRLSKDDVICMYELRLSQEIKKAGWNIKSCLIKYNTIDYRQEHADINFSSHNGDPLYRGGYFGSTATPYEFVFVKTNRDLIRSSALYWYTLHSLFAVKNNEVLRWDAYRKLRRTAIAKMLVASWRDAKHIISNRVHAILRRRS